MNDELKTMILAALATSDEKPDVAVVSPEKKEYNVSARQISNGWVVTESWVEEQMEGDNCCRNWKDVQTYYPSLPFQPSNA